MTYVSDKELSQKCFEFYNTGYENKVALPDAILRWQKSLGYDSDVTVNWIIA